MGALEPGESVLFLVLFMLSSEDETKEEAAPSGNNGFYGLPLSIPSRLHRSLSEVAGKVGTLTLCSPLLALGFIPSQLP